MSCQRSVPTLICFFLATAEVAIFGQGSLAPPGAPAPSFRTLLQIEPRTPIASAPFTITHPGSYYLAGNLTIASGVAITINVSFVDLDLNGFTISGTAATATGGAIAIGASNLTDITIKNGHIKSGVTYNGTSFSNGPGFGYGIFWLGTGEGELPTDGLRNVRVS